MSQAEPFVAEGFGAVADAFRRNFTDCGEDAAGTVSGIVASGGCDEILLSTQPEHHPHWHRHSLPKQIDELGIPTTVIPPDATGWSADHGFPDGWVRIEAGPLT